MLKKLNRVTTSLPQQRPIKVLQFGGGNFLRAFADWMIDLLNEQANFDGAVQIVQSTKSGKGDLLNEQQGLYHVVLNGIKNGSTFEETRLITCVNGAINPSDDYQAFLKAAENPDLKFIISNTTEVGIAFNHKDTSNLTLAESFPGKLTALLYHRFAYFKGASDKGLILLPCELLEKNGEALKQTIHQFIAHWHLSNAFAEWINNCNIFCNTLVDRIVPGFPKDKINEIQESTGYEDNLVVMAEPFHLFVIESPEVVREAFPADKIGLSVKFVKDLTPYRTSKVRILNGAHTTLVPVAYLHGFRTVRESIEDKVVGEFIHKALYDEIIPTLDLPKEELHQFAHDVMERFQNPFIRHELMSIALNSISKYKVRVLPSVLKYVELKKQLPEKLILSLAALIRFYKGEWRGEIITLNDTPEVLSSFKNAWSSADLSTVAHKILSNKSLWGIDLTIIAGLEDKVKNHLQKMELEQRLF
ncbi:MAG TPA: tagaturonate reductase [Cyclobacteriaceae bacterium]|jgi:tagaturonate reductase|nr:tagaturonate reductase [Cyclobacteriaceae bacterium]